MFVLMPILLLAVYMFNDDNEIIHCHEMPSPASRRKSKFFPQFGLYILKELIRLISKRERTRNERSTNKINRFEHFRRNLVIVGSTLSVSIKVDSLL